MDEKLIRQKLILIILLSGRFGFKNKGAIKKEDISTLIELFFNSSESLIEFFNYAISKKEHLNKRDRAR